MNFVGKFQSYLGSFGFNKYDFSDGKRNQKLSYSRVLYEFPILFCLLSEA